MKIYTRSGDTGETSLVYGERIMKNDILVEAFGTIDEANSVIGHAVATLSDDLTWSKDVRRRFVAMIENCQALLFSVGAELSTPKNKQVAWPLKEEAITALEKQIDELDEQVPTLTQFILPSGHQAATILHHARTVVRRAERLTVGIKKEINPQVIVYLNRLSDFLFVAARFINTFSTIEEKPFVYKSDTE